MAERLTPEQIADVLVKHDAWLRGLADGVRADLTMADLTMANLSGAYARTAPAGWALTNGRLERTNA